MKVNLLPGYDVRKAAQVAAFFAIKAGGKINKLRLVKLIYLADRQFMIRYDEPMLYDVVFSMDYGPVDSITLNFLNGDLPRYEGTTIYLTPPSEYSVSLVNPDLTTDDLDRLSEAEIEVLKSVWKRWHFLNEWQLVDHVHTLPEWVDPHGSSLPVPYKELFRLLNKEHSDKLAEEVERRRALSKAMMA